ncbi:MAG: indole-3-glycerol phosphate synthase TrpC [Candidatus Omnitrophica bacterium]|nr:indole-3-glycerol phosphate synthase TrpC [Candidatus Omnitrophota bacterium]
MTTDFLKKIVEHKKQIVVDRRHIYASIQEKLGREKYTNYHLFKMMISKPGRINLIAEIKKASPSKGILRDNFDVLEIARCYKNHQAAAISVLAEEKYFLGSPTYVKKVSDEVGLPVLMKDFFIDEGQLFEARYNGASAVLLIAAILDDEQLRSLNQKAQELDLDCLVEVHDETELNRALNCGADIIGINNRNLRTFEIDLQTSCKLIPKIPKGKVIVAESGLQTNEDIKQLHEMGVNAVLIGETFMRAQDIGKKIDEIMR